MHGHVLSDFAKADRVWVEKLLDAVSAEIPALAEGDAPRFMSRVAETISPPRPKPPRQTFESNGDTPSPAPSSNNKD